MNILKKIVLILNVAYLNYKKLKVYTTANISGLLVNLFWLVIQAEILYAFIRYGISDYTPMQGVGYMIITESLLMITGLNRSLGGIDIEEVLKSGSIIQYWINPLGFVEYLIGMEIGRLFYYMIWRSLPILIIGCAVFRWFPSLAYSQLILFFLSVFIAVILANIIEFIITILAIRCKTSSGIVDLFMTLALFFSGGLLPINLFPEWLYKLAIYLPFSAQIYLPVSIILGTENQVVFLLFVEGLWSIILGIVAYVLYIKERRYLLVQGG